MSRLSIDEIAIKTQEDLTNFPELEKSVRHLTSNVIKKYHYFDEYNDLCSMARYALLTAVLKYNSDKGPFGPYYLSWCRQLIKRDLLKGSMIRLPEAVVNLNAKVDEEHKRLLGMYNILARNGGKDLELYSELLEVLSHHYECTQGQLERILKIKKVITVTDAFVLNNIVTKTSDYDSKLNLDLLNKKLKDILSGMDKRVAQAIDLYYGLTSRSPLTVKEVSEQMGISIQDVKSLLDVGLKLFKRGGRMKLLKDFIDN